jgi:hypothetical protein
MLATADKSYERSQATASLIIKRVNEERLRGLLDTLLELFADFDVSAASQVDIDAAAKVMRLRGHGTKSFRYVRRRLLAAIDSLFTLFGDFDVSAYAQGVIDATAREVKSITIGERSFSRVLLALLLDFTVWSAPGAKRAYISLDPSTKTAGPWTTRAVLDAMVAAEFIKLGNPLGTAETYILPKALIPKRG